jgi:hypothetical protein
MSKHTPGPWAIDWNVSRLDVFSADAATLVATIRRSALSAAIDDAAKADARLIAAAPELLAELRAARDYLSCIPESAAGGDDDAGRLVKRIDALIAKATGGTI